MADDPDAVHLNDLARDRTLDIAALFDRKIDDHRPGLHARDLRGRDQPRRGAAGDQRGGDDDVLLGDVPGDKLGLRGLIFGAHLARIAARPLALDPGDAFDEDRFRAERLDLFARRGADAVAETCAPSRRAVAIA